VIFHHGSTEARSKLIAEDLTEKIIGAAIGVHRVLGRLLDKRVGVDSQFSRRDAESRWNCEKKSELGIPCLSVSVVIDERRGQTH